jgi:uncharacterized membrane protein YjfL (UPF0719 family)
MPPLYLIAFGVLTPHALLLHFELGQRVLSPKHTVRADLEQGNAARGLLQGGYVLGIFIIAAHVVAAGVQAQSLQHDLLWVAAFGVADLLLFAITGRIGVRLLLKARLPAEIERGNAAAGLAAASHYVATAIVIGRCITGSDLFTLGISLVWFAIAQLTLHLVVLLFRALTDYDDDEEILGENVAAALSYAGITLAVALLIGRAVQGEFLGWLASLRGYGFALSFVLALYLVRQVLVQSILLGARFSPRGGRLDRAIAAERNVGMGALEAAAYLATALAVTRFE